MSLQLDDDAADSTEPVMETEEQQQEEGNQEEASVIWSVMERDPDLVRYQSLWTVVDEGWASLELQLDEFVAKKEPWEKMADLFTELDDWRDDMKEQLDVTVKRGDELFRLNRNPGPITETYRVSNNTAILILLVCTYSVDLLM